MRRRRYRIIERTNSGDAGLGFIRKKVGVVYRFRTSVSVEFKLKARSATLKSQRTLLPCPGQSLGLATALPQPQKNACGVSLGRLLSQASKGEMVCVGTLS